MNQTIEQFIHREERRLLVTKTPSLRGDDAELKRAEIKDYFHRTFTLYERLFECLASDEAYYIKATPLRHPLIFYYGHTAAFLINKLRVAKLIPDRLNPDLEAMVAIGVDEMSWDDLDEANYNWPTPETVKQYRDGVRELVDEFIDAAPLTLPIQWEDPIWIVLMGIEHERIHLETSSVLIRQLPLDLVQPSRLFSLSVEQDVKAPQNELLPVQGKAVTLGKDRDNQYYGWDNEYGKQRVDVAAFQASKYLVSNGEYLEFVEAGGYSNQNYWTEEGWAWREYTGASRPEFWLDSGDGLRYRAMTHEIEMPWSWPVDVNYLEAKAFCNWKSAQTGQSIRLPSEAEWYAMRADLNSDQPDWEQAPGNINLEHGASACPVNRFSTRLENGSELFDLIGNVWQWTETPIDGLPGFEVHPAYDDFSTPTFDGQHNLIKGGSYFSTGNYAIKDSRYAFRRHFFQHAGLRYIESEGEFVIRANPYETDELISQYLEFHYGEEHFGIENFARRCGEICNRLAARKGLAGSRTDMRAKALDIGCAVGRTSFELAKQFDEVDAVDFSARFIAAVTELQKTGIKRYTMRTEGNLVDFKEIQLDSLGYTRSAPRCSFMQGDACNLSDRYSGYNLVFAGNLIDRLYAPRQFLSTIHEHLNVGGLLVLTSPYTWLEEYTGQDQWLGGFKDQAGENFTTLDGLQETLGARFEMVEEPQDVPFIIRETARKFQHTLAQMSIWIRTR